MNGGLSSLFYYMGSDTFLTIKSFSEGLYKEKGSRFIALAYPVTDQEEIKSIIENLRKEHHSARHHCFAWMLGHDRLAHRMSDDGEPSGTAGKPILGQINAFKVTNILVVVVRYFGGKLLGVSGLVNAYRSAAKSALSNSVIIEQFVMDSYELIFPYSSLNEVMKVVKEAEARQSQQIFDLKCQMTITLRSSARERILKNLSLIEGLSVTYSATS
jgi:uncharacterized YigZ family protein